MLDPTNKTQFSTVADSLDSLQNLIAELQWFAHKTAVAMDNDYFEPGANLGDVLDLTRGYDPVFDEHRLQLSKEDIRKLTVIGSSLTPRYPEDA